MYEQIMLTLSWNEISLGNEDSSIISSASGSFRALSGKFKSKNRASDINVGEWNRRAN